MLSSLSEDTLRGRFFEDLVNVTHEMLVRFTNIDYDREMAIVAELTTKKKKRIIGIGRLIAEGDGGTGEFAVVVHDDFQGKGLGFKLTDVIIGIAQEKGLRAIDGYISSSNGRMLRVVDELGFEVVCTEDRVTTVRLTLE